MKKIKKYVKLIKFAAAAATVAMAVYTLIPKSEKITGVDLEEFAMRNAQFAIAPDASETENEESAK